MCGIVRHLSETQRIGQAAGDLRQMKQFASLRGHGIVVQGDALLEAGGGTPFAGLDDPGLAEAASGTYRSSINTTVPFLLLAMAVGALGRPRRSAFDLISWSGLAIASGRSGDGR